MTCDLIRAVFVSGNCLLFRESGESLGTHWCQMVIEADGRVWGHVEIEAATDDTFDQWLGIGRLMITVPAPQTNPGAEPELSGSRAVLDLADEVARVSEQMRDEPVAIWCEAMTQRPGGRVHLLVSSDMPEHRVDQPGRPDA